MNKYVLTWIGMIVLVFIFNSCSEKQEIERIDAKYYIGVFKGIVSIPYQELQNEKPKIDTVYLYNDFDIQGVIDTVITNPLILSQIQEELSQIKVLPDKENLEDVRIVCNIEYKDGRKDKLSINGEWATLLMLNGHYCEQNNKLVYLIKKNIGYYSIYGELVLEQFKELQDSCFIDTIVNDQGQKYWRGKKTVQPFTIYNPNVN